VRRASSRARLPTHAPSFPLTPHLCWHALFLTFPATHAADYCSGQSLPNCRGWAKYLVAPSAGTPGAAPITLQAATTQWFEALFSGGGSYAAALRAGQLAVEAHSRGQAASPAAAAPTVSQWVDAVRYPNNPSCYFPPGR